MVIKIKELCKGLYTQAVNENNEPVPFINPKGDCIDLRAAKDTILQAPEIIIKKQNGNKFSNIEFHVEAIGLGLAIQLPKGLVGRIVERSSGCTKLFIKKMAGGYIDNCYNGDNDEWKVPVSALKDITVHKGDRICQFHVELSQFATPWQKLKWLFSKPKFVFVDSLGNSDRGGFGTSGVK